MVRGISLVSPDLGLIQHHAGFVIKCVQQVGQVPHGVFFCCAHRFNVHGNDPTPVDHGGVQPRRRLEQSVRHRGVDAGQGKTDPRLAGYRACQVQTALRCQR